MLSPYVDPKDVIDALPDELRQRLAAAPQSPTESERLWKVQFSRPGTKEAVWAEILLERLHTLFETSAPLPNQPFMNLAKDTIMTDQTIDPNRGTFHATANGARPKNDKKPTFRGTLTLPGDPTERPVVLWARRNKTGNLILTGHTRDNGSDALAKLDTLVDGRKPVEAEPVTVGTGESALKLNPRDVVLFEMADKTGRRPHFYGYHHSGEKNQPTIGLAIWTEIDQTDKLTLSGITRSTKVTEQEQHDDQDEDQDLEPSQ